MMIGMCNKCNMSIAVCDCNQPGRSSLPVVTKIVLLGEQADPVMVGKLESGAAVIQTDNGWITIEKEHLAGTATALFAVLGDVGS
ncbi:MAG: hypothetical protein GY804_00965 [Alphaproteobacteria bacterium]|nr:hypothetical protein [Alphaproteobacteria bacterium]